MRPDIAVRTRGRRAFWGFADQAVGSLGNFVLLILVARSSSQDRFGAFVVVLAAYALTAGASRALVSEVILFEYPRLLPEQQFRAGALGAALVGGVIGAVPVILLGAFTPLGAGFILLGAFLPFLILQDVERHIMLASHRQRDAFVNDLLWTFTALAAISVYAGYVTLTLASALVLWAGGGLLASLVGLAQLRILPRQSQIAPYLRLTRPFVGSLMVEYLVVTFAANVVLLILTGIIGLVGVGGLRAATAIYSPLNTLFQASRTVLIPWLSRQAAAGHDIVRKVAAVSATFLVCAGGAAIVISALPDSVGRSLFGPSWLIAGSLVGLAGIDRVLASVAVGPMLGLRALREVRRGLLSRASVAAAAMIFGLIGGLLDGARGALLGSIAAWTFGLFVYGRAFMRIARPDEARGRDRARVA